MIIYFLLLLIIHQKFYKLLNQDVCILKLRYHNKKVLIFLTKLFNKDIHSLINNDLISHYFTPGDLLNLYNFSFEKKIDLSKMKLEEFLLEIIDNHYYKKDILSINLIFAFLQMYFIKKLII